MPKTEITVLVREKSLIPKSLLQRRRDFLNLKGEFNRSPSLSYNVNFCYDKNILHKMLNHGIYPTPVQFEATFFTTLYTKEDLDKTILAHSESVA